MGRALTLRKQDRKESGLCGFRGISQGFCLALDLVKLINCFCKDNFLVALEHFSFYYVCTCVGMCLSDQICTDISTLFLEDRAQCLCFFLSLCTLEEDVLFKTGTNLLSQSS